MPAAENGLYFFHIPKTAGSSVRRYLAKAYPKDQTLTFTKPGGLLDSGPEKLESIRFFHGHVGCLLYRVLGREIPTITFLRDPFEQTISWLRYRESKVPASKLFYRLLSPRLIAYRRGFSPLVHRAMDAVCRAQGHQDFQTHYLGVDFRDVPDDRLPRDYMTMIAIGLEQSRDLGMDAILERAKRRLDSMAVVGITERFAESLELVGAFAGLPAPAQFPELNVGPGRKVGDSYRNDPRIPPALMRFADKHTRYDRLLYSYANELLERRIQSAERGQMSGGNTGSDRRVA